jgi:G3E family GTPase
MSTRIAVIGGFLGAGKTTLLTNLARKYMGEGRSVALITNDQGEVLVDTQYAKDLGIETAEVLKGCFCCKFPDFIDSARRLVDTVRPDIIMAEPVGSCTDLLATVVAPLKFRFPSEFEVAPLIILLDGTRIARGIEEEGSLGAYLRKHQVQEAEVIVLTKMDLIASGEISGLMGMVEEMNPGARIIPYSAVTGHGLTDISRLIVSRDRSLKRPVGIDYEIYAQAEAELGWYNGTFSMVLPEGTDSYHLASEMMSRVSKAYLPGEIAHVKMLLESRTNAIKMSLVFQSLGVDGVKGGRRAEGSTTINMNARVVSAPEKLRQVMREAVLETLCDNGVTAVDFKDDCFSPGRPDPTYRMADGE